MLNENVLGLIAKNLDYLNDQYAFRCTCSEFKSAIDVHIGKCYIDFHINDSLKSFPSTANMTNLNISSYNQNIPLNVLFKDLGNQRKHLKSIYIETPYAKLFPKHLKGCTSLETISLFLSNTKVQKGQFP
jgi:hypothetical protein